jgi:hypothetical protein
MKSLLAIAAVGTALASFSAPASADPFDHDRDHFRFGEREIVRVGSWCGPDRHINWQGVCAWDHPHLVAPFVFFHPFHPFRIWR